MATLRLHALSRNYPNAAERCRNYSHAAWRCRGTMCQPLGVCPDQRSAYRLKCSI